MRIDHIVELNRKLVDAREQADQTLSALHDQRDKLADLITSAEQMMRAIDVQIDQLEAFRQLSGELAAEDVGQIGPKQDLDLAESGKTMIAPFHQPDKLEKVNGRTNGGL